MLNGAFSPQNSLLPSEHLSTILSTKGTHSPQFLERFLLQLSVFLTSSELTEKLT